MNSFLQNPIISVPRGGIATRLSVMNFLTSLEDKKIQESLSKYIQRMNFILENSDICTSKQLGLIGQLRIRMLIKNLKKLSSGFYGNIYFWEVLKLKVSGADKNTYREVTGQDISKTFELALLLGQGRVELLLSLSNPAFHINENVLNPLIRTISLMVAIVDKIDAILKD